MFFTVIISDSVKLITSLNPSKEKFSAGMTEGQSVAHAPTAVQFSSVTQSYLTLCTPWTGAHQASLSITNSRSPLKLLSIESVMPSNHPLSSPSPPAFNLSQHQFFQMSQLFLSGGQSIGVSSSASVLPMNIQD